MKLEHGTRPVVAGPEVAPVEIKRDKSDIDAIGKTKAMHPSMSDVKSIPGYRENPDGTWSAPANGAWGEAMRPYWRADLERHQNNLGNGAYEHRSATAGTKVGYSRAFAEAPYWSED